MISEATGRSRSLGTRVKPMRSHSIVRKRSARSASETLRRSADMISDA